MSVRSELSPLYKTLYTVIRQCSNTLVVSHTNVFGSTTSDDMGIRYDLLDNEDLMFGRVIQ